MTEERRKIGLSQTLWHLDDELIKKTREMLIAELVGSACTDVQIISDCPSWATDPETGESISTHTIAVAGMGTETSHRLLGIPW